MKKYLILVFSFLLLNTCYIYSQKLEIKPLDFVTKKGDKVGAEFCQLIVLENRENTESKKINLSFVRFKSTSDKPSSPIVYLAGGPGGSGIETAKGERFGLFMKLREIADVIVLDQRGVGESNILKKCPFYAEFSQYKATEKQEYFDKATENIKKCMEFWSNGGHTLESYNTTENAKDIEELRKSLGADKISLLGISYGSHLAMEYIKRFEKNIDKVILASLEGPDETIKYPMDTEAFINKICTAAKGNNGFLPKYPNLRNILTEVHDKLKKEGKMISFITKKGKQDSVAISNFELQGIITNFYLKNPEDQSKLPALYTNLWKGDYSEIVPLAIGVKRYASTINPMSFAMDMSSNISKKRNMEIQLQIPKSLYGTSLNFLYYEWMNSLPFKYLPDEFRYLPNNKVKALLLSGDLDGRTYLKSAQEIAKRFKNGLHIIIENGGHDTYMTTDEVENLMIDFLIGNKIQTKKIVLPIIPFI